jgi:hypothetical protein
MLKALRITLWEMALIGCRAILLIILLKISKSRGAFSFILGEQETASHSPILEIPPHGITISIPNEKQGKMP